MNGYAQSRGVSRRWFLRIERKRQDVWVGAYWDRPNPWALDVWLCLVPMLPIHFGYQPEVRHG